MFVRRGRGGRARRKRDGGGGRARRGRGGDGCGSEEVEPAGVADNETEAAAVLQNVSAT